MFGRETEMERLLSSLPSECVQVRVSLTPANTGTRDRLVGIAVSWALRGPSCVFPGGFGSMSAEMWIVLKGGP